MSSQPTTGTALEAVTFRQSGLKSLLMCPLRWKYENIDKLPTKATGAMFVGTAFHEAIRLTFDSPPTLEEYVPEGAAPYFQAGWVSAEERYVRDGQEVTWYDPKEKEAIKAYTAFEHWFTEVAPSLKPSHYELEFGNARKGQAPFPVPGLEEVYIEGTIDYVEGRYLKDWKTSGRAWQKSDVARDLQASMYSLAFRELTGELPEEFEFVVYVKGNSPRLERYPTTRTPEQIERFIWTLGEWASQIRAGIFSPNTNGWWCGERFCSFHSSCPAGGGFIPGIRKPPRRKKARAA